MRSLKANAFLNGIKQICSIIFPFITFPYVSRILGNEGYGKFSFSYSIVYYFILFAALGIGTYAIREGPKIRDDNVAVTKFCSQVFSINVISTVTSYLVLIILIVASVKVRSYALYILIQSTAMIMSLLGTDWVNSIFEDYLYITIRYIGVQVVALVLMFIFVQSPSDIWKYCIISVLATNGGNLINIFYIRKYVKIKFTLHMGFFKHIKPLLVLFANAIASSIYVNADVTMLGFYSTDSYVGVYSFASKIYNMLKSLINSTINAAVPRISYVIQNEPDRYREYMNEIFRGVNFFVFPIVTGLFFMSDSIIYVAGGSAYLSGSIALKILSFATIFGIYGSLFSNCVLIVNRREDQCLKSTTVSAISNVGLNFIVIPLWGMNGAAVTTIIAETVNFVMQVMYSKELFNWKSLDIKSVKFNIIGAVGIAIVCMLSNLSFYDRVIRLLIAVPISAVIYFLILLIGKNDLMISLCMKFRRIIK